jgi:hypothetical protein
MADLPAPDSFDGGFVLGVLVCAAHFGGDGKRPQITLRMHTRHEALFRRLEHAVPGGKLNGPYHHGGRSYYQWSVRGRALPPLVDWLQGHLTPEVDAHAHARFQRMCATYGLGSARRGDTTT